MRVLLLGGGGGQLTTALKPLLEARDGWVSVSKGRPELDVTNGAALRRAILEARPEVIVNATAYTAVDKAESDREAAFAVNAAAPEVMGAAANEAGAAVIHVSTDYVFDGRAARPYREDDPTGPQGVYGASKLAGEQALAARCARHVILRTSWLYGSSGNNFLRSMLRLGAERESLAIVDDQTGCPTAVGDLAEAIMAVLEKLSGGAGEWGLFHYCGGGAPCSWYGFAEEIFRQAAAYGYPAPQLRRTTTAAFGAPAPRPAYSVLDCSRIAAAYGVRRRDWREAVGQVLSEIVSAEQETAERGRG
jgi:dTDP-4-dehydrorhamnose reductase